MVDMTEGSCIDNGCLLCGYYSYQYKKYKERTSIPCPGQFKLASMETLIARYIDEDSVSCKNRLKDALLKYYNYHIDSSNENNNKEETNEMKLFSECRDACILCACFRIGCLAGHGDDDFVQASQEDMIARLYDTNISESDKRVLVKGLEKYYHIDSSVIEQYRELVGNPYDVSIEEFMRIKKEEECNDSTTIDHVNKDWLDALYDSKDYVIKHKDLAYKPQTNEEPYDFNSYMKMANDLYESAMEELVKTRPTKDQYYLNIAMTVATRGTCMRRKFGAIIVKNDKIVSTGYAGAPRGRENCCDRGVCYRMEHNIPSGSRYEACRSVHAEMNAIIQASKEEMDGATLYLCGIENNGSFTDAAPCSMCKRVIINAGIETVIARQSNGDIKITPVSSYIENDDSLDINHVGY